MDEFREQSNEGASFFTEDLSLDPDAAKKKQQQAQRKRSGKILGMTALQRMAISMLLMLFVCVGGILVLLMTSKVVLF